MTTVNPQTGTKHPDMEPLKTLRRYGEIIEHINVSADLKIHVLQNKYVFNFNPHLLMVWYGMVFIHSTSVYIFT